MKQNRDFLTKPTIIGENIIIRPFEEKDVETILSILDEPTLKKLTGSVSCDEEANVGASQEEKERIRNWYRTRNEQNDRLDLAIADKSTDQVLGELVYNEYDEDTGNANFRVLLSEFACDKGIGTEAISLFIKYGMEVLKLHKISLEVYSFNPRAEKVYQKVGFKLEGVKRESFLYNNAYVDTKMYGLLDYDYFSKD